ncbi:sialidase family protein [Hamadaea tsunoensis]|uniref:sialidase family protein n=1 Tax=Hamadaea tsunoensis TaxID=53368 RepID=UPI0004001A42|nr:sialidase family protein [Hamadaea tsunoensis]
MRMRTLLRAVLAVAVLTVPAVTALPPAALAATTIFAEGQTYNGVTYECFRIPSIVRFPDGELVAFAEGRITSVTPGRVCEDNGNIDVVTKHSYDNGATWTDFGIAVKGNKDVKDSPAPFIVPGTDKIVLLTAVGCIEHPSCGSYPCRLSGTTGTDPVCGRQPRVSYSSDRGRTWTAPKDITGQLGWTFPPAWLAIGPGHGIVLSPSGRFVGGMNYINGGVRSAALIYSDDQGVTWHRGESQNSTATVDPGELAVAQTADGKVYVNARNQANPTGDLCENDGRDNRTYAVSPDGATLSKKFGFESDLVTPTAYGSLLAVGNRLLFANPSICDRRHDLRIRTSFDNGCSWQTISDQGKQVWANDASYTDMVQISSTSVGLIGELGPDGNAAATLSWLTFNPTTLGTPHTLVDTPDSSGNGLDSCLSWGTTGAPATVAGRVGTAVKLGGGSYVKIPYAAADATGAGDFTWSGWFDTSSATGTQAVLWAYDQGAGKPQVWLRLEASGTGVRVRGHAEAVTAGTSAWTTTTADIFPAPVLAVNSWHHFALVRSGTTLSLYLDGVFAGAKTGLTGNVSASGEIAGLDAEDQFTIHLGHRPDRVLPGDAPYPFSGMLDEISLYKRALTDTEIAALASATTTPASPALALSF